MVWIKKISSYHQIIDVVRAQTRRANLLLTENSEKFQEFVLNLVEILELRKEVVKKLAEDYFKIPFYDPPKQFRLWHPSICKKLKAIKYVNPLNSNDYIVIVARTTTGMIECLHHFPNGYQSLDWFAEFVPKVCLATKWNEFQQEVYQSMLKSGQKKIDYTTREYRGMFSRHIGTPINKEYSNLDPYAIRAIHGLLDLYVPTVEGICSKCFQARFAEKGHGISYLHRPTLHDNFEIKISPPKSDGESGQQRLYVTNTLVVHGQSIFILWTPWESDKPIFSKEATVFDAHIPYRVLHQKQLLESLSEPNVEKQVQQFLGTKKQINLPLCQCK